MTFQVYASITQATEALENNPVIMEAFDRMCRSVSELDEEIVERDLEEGERDDEEYSEEYADELEWEYNERKAIEELSNNQAIVEALFKMLQQDINTP